MTKAWRVGGPEAFRISMSRPQITQPYAENVQGEKVYIVWIFFLLLLKQSSITLPYVAITLD